MSGIAQKLSEERNEQRSVIEYNEVKGKNVGILSEFDGNRDKTDQWLRSTDQWITGYGLPRGNEPGQMANGTIPIDPMNLMRLDDEAAPGILWRTVRLARRRGNNTDISNFLVNPERD